MYARVARFVYLFKGNCALIENRDAEGTLDLYVQVSKMVYFGCLEP